MQAQNTPSHWIKLGHVSKPHGVRGALLVKCPPGQGDSLDVVKKIWIGEDDKDTKEPFEVVRSQWMPKGWKLTLKNVDTFEMADALKRKSLFVVREMLPPTAEDEFYTADLCGLTALDATTLEPIGTLERIERASNSPLAHDLWCISLSTPVHGQKEVMVPATGAFILKVDLKARTFSLQDWKELV